MVLRERIVRFLLETEQSYIQSLNTLIKDYEDLLLSTTQDNSPVKEVFWVLPQLVVLHGQLAADLEERVSSWCGEQTIGDTLTKTFSQSQLTVLYSSYIKYYSQARVTIDSIKQSKPALAKEIEEKSRDNHGSYGKLSLEDLLIKPVQRIPRYLLFVKDLIKNTTSDHTDYYHLQQALEDLSLLARRVDEMEGESKMLQQKKDLLSTVDGLSECVSKTSTLVRCETVTEIRGSTQRKDRLLILFSDLLVCAASRRRSSGFKRGSLMNINSLHTDMLRYRIKWTSTLSSLSITRSQAPETERKRYNTLERELHHTQKDEDLLLQLAQLASSLHTPHQELDLLLQEMLTKVRGSMSTRRQEMDSLPHDSARLDLLSHDCSPPAKYFLLFNSHSSRLDWEKSLRRTQLINTPHNALLPTNTEESTRHRTVRSGSPYSSATHYICHTTMPSCRVGSQLSSAVAARSNKQLYVCVNDASGRGSIAILNKPSGGGQPQLVATLPLSTTALLCASCVQHPLSTDISDGGDVDEPDCRSTCSSPSDSWTYTGSPYVTDPTFPPSPPSSALDTRFPSHDTPTPQDTYLRSSSAPPNAFQAILRHTTPMSLVIGPSHSNTDINKIGRLSPSRSGEEWLWVGSEGGVVHMMKVMPSSLDIASSMSYCVGAPVLEIVQHGGWVWAGLGDGRLVIFNVATGTPNIEYIAPLSRSSLQAMVAVGNSLLVASGNIVYSVSYEADSMTLVKKDVLTLPDNITHMVGGCGNKIYVCVQSSMIVRGCVQREGHWEVITTVDCTPTLMTSLKSYSSIVRQHKLSNPHITSIVTTPKAVIIGTSAGVMMALYLSSPVPQTLPRGHINSVQTLLHIPSEKRDIVVSGGHGLEELTRAQVCEDVLETEGCLLFWSISKYLKIT